MIICTTSVYIVCVFLFTYANTWQFQYFIGTGTHKSKYHCSLLNFFFKFI